MARLPKQPPNGSSLWNGKKTKDNSAYLRECAPFSPFANQVVLADPEEEPPDVDPAEVARRAVDKMALRGPKIESPRAGGDYTVGVPMWMHVDSGSTVYGPNSASATLDGVTIEATAKVKRIEWEMGDGESVTCTSRGTPYQKSFGMKRSPDCGHLYQQTSDDEPGGEFTVTATSTWAVEWEVSDGSDSGEFTETRESQVDIPVGEAQVVN